MWELYLGIQNEFALLYESWGRAIGGTSNPLKWEGSGVPTVLTLFLTWSGTNKEILANITKEGKKLMATADSVFTKVTSDLINGTILVGQLELIVKHMNQFFDLWHLSKYQVEMWLQAPKGLGAKKLLCLPVCLRDVIFVVFMMSGSSHQKVDRGWLLIFRKILGKW